jgi:hypothetical protein
MYVITPDCPIECLAPLLSLPTYTALVAALESPATVGQVVDLYEHGGLLDLYNIGSGRAGEIRRCLLQCGLIRSDRSSVITRRSVLNASVPRGHDASCPKYLSVGN